MNFSQEYIAAVVITIGLILKGFGIELENKALEGVITGALAIWIAVRRYQKKDINIIGAKI